MNDLTMENLETCNFRGLVKAVFEGGSARVAAMWNYSEYKAVRDAIRDAVLFFEDQTNIRAEYVMMRSLPKGIENGHEFGNVTLLEADWVSPKYIFVCARMRGL